MAGLVITPEIEADAQRLAERTGQTPTEAVASALHNELQPHAAALGRTGFAKVRSPKNLRKIRTILERIHSAPTDNSLSEDEILGYDGFGVPEQP